MKAQDYNSFEDACKAIEHTNGMTKQERSEHKKALRIIQSKNLARDLLKDILAKPKKQQKIELTELTLAMLLQLQQQHNVSGKGLASMIRLLNDLLGLNKVDVQSEDTPPTDNDVDMSDILGEIE